jgi:dTMP kinase
VTCALKHSPVGFRVMIAQFKKMLAEQTGHEILEFVTNPDENTPQQIYLNDIKNCVMAADLIIADLSLPSTGQGYEMGTMKELRIGPIIGIASVGTDVSKFILGMPNFQVSFYHDLASMVKIAKERINDFIKNRGILIVIDGSDGSGKATQVKLLADHLTTSGKKVKTMDFPRYKDNHFGRLIGECLDGQHGDFKGLDPRIASVLYAADRFESSRQIKQWIDEGNIVVLDRYVSANQLHQGGKIKDDVAREGFLNWLDHMEHGIFGLPRPDVIIYLDVPVEVSQKLMLEKNSIEKKQQNERSSIVPDQHESDPEHLQNAKESGLKMVAAKSNWIRIECCKDQEILSKPVIHEKIFTAIGSYVYLD